MILPILFSLFSQLHRGDRAYVFDEIQTFRLLVLLGMLGLHGSVHDRRQLDSRHASQIVLFTLHLDGLRDPFLIFRLANIIKDEFK